MMEELTYEKYLEKATNHNTKVDLIYANGINIALGINLDSQSIETKMESLDSSVFNIYNKLKDSHNFCSTEGRLSFY